jgi:hypothetical protein
MKRNTESENEWLDELASALDTFADGPSSVSSIRQPEGLRRAMQAAVALGWARNANEGVVESLREELTAFCRSRALEAHFLEHPGARPSLAGVAVALAELDHDPLADEPELIERAAREIVAVRPDADADDVLIWAASLRHSRG